LTAQFEVLKINMSTFNRSIPFLGLCLCGLMMSGPASAEIKMGVVNFQKLLEDAPQTKTAMQALENEFAPRRRELLTMQNDLKARDEKLQKEGAVMSETDRAKAEKVLRDQQREFSRKAGEFQDDASTRRNEEIGKVQRYLVTEIQGYANAQGFDLVLGEGVFFAKGPLDITANVLAVLATKPANLPAVTPAAPAPAKAPAISTTPGKTPGGK
jgi:outer membrane protein